MSLPKDIVPVGRYAYPGACTGPYGPAGPTRLIPVLRDRLGLWVRKV